jgi:molybdate transport repressor ModE-like protein
MPEPCPTDLPTLQSARAKSACPTAAKALTPDALAMMDAIARTGSFAAAARELGKVPSALTYSVRQLEEALDALLFDRSSRQAQLTAAGSELLHEGRRLLQEMDAVANRVRRVASGWETQLSISVEDILSTPTIFELVQAFCEVRDGKDDRVHEGPATRLRLRTDVLAGTWEALVTREVDLAIGVSGEYANPGGIEVRPLGRTALCLLRGAAPPAGRGAGAAGRRATGAPPRRGRGRHGAAHDTGHGEPAAGAGRADGVQHARQAGSAAARPGQRLPARTAGACADRSRAPGAQGNGAQRAGGAAALRLACRARCAGPGARAAVVAGAAGKPHHAARAAGTPRGMLP